MHILINFLLVVHILICVLMVLVVLMQRPRSEGLGAAFGGGMTENLFGAQTTTVLTRFTVWLGAAFFALTLILAILYAKSTRQTSAVREKLMGAPAPAAPVDSASPAADPVASPMPSPTAPSTPTPADKAAPAPEPQAPATSESSAPSPMPSPVPNAVPAP